MSASEVTVCQNVSPENAQNAVNYFTEYFLFFCKISKKYNSTKITTLKD